MSFYHQPKQKRVRKHPFDQKIESKGISFSRKAQAYNVYHRYNDSKKTDISEYYQLRSDTEKRLTQI